MHPPLRILLIAEACNPEWSSVPLVGWSLAQALREVADVHVVTQVRNRDGVVRAGWIEGREFTAIDSERVARPVHRLAERLCGGAGRGWTVGTALNAISYRYFEKLLWRRFRPTLRRREFDLVHRITPLSPTTPSWIAPRLARAGVPFVLGPLNGGLPWPRQFDSARRAEFEWLSYVRGLHRLLPGYRATRRHAAALIIGSRATWEQMPRRYRARCVYIPENAVDPQRFTVRRQHAAGRPICAVFLGRLVPYKGPDMVLDAAEPLLRAGDLTLDLIGDGPLRPQLEAAVRERGLTGGVRLTGWMDHQQVQHELARADVLTFPSIREFGGAVVLEAMAVGVLPIVVDYGGPGELVTPETGFRIELGSRAQIVERLGALLGRLVADPTAIDARSPAAVERVQRHFTWPAKARMVAEVYRWVLGQRAERPGFVHDDTRQ